MQRHGTPDAVGALIDGVADKMQEQDEDEPRGRNAVERNLSTHAPEDHIMVEQKKPAGDDRRHDSVVKKSCQPCADVATEAELFLQRADGKGEQAEGACRAKSSERQTRCDSFTRAQRQRQQTPQRQTERQAFAKTPARDADARHALPRRENDNERRHQRNERPHDVQAGEKRRAEGRQIEPPLHKQREHGEGVERAGFDAAAPVVRSVGAAIVSRCPHFFISREFFLHYITMREREKYFFAVPA